MKIPTKAELNGRVYYVTLAENEAEGTMYVRYAGTDQSRAHQLAANPPAGIVVAGGIDYDAREAGQE
jgi:hypothetical protein